MRDFRLVGPTTPRLEKSSVNPIKPLSTVLTTAVIIQPTITSLFTPAQTTTTTTTKTAVTTTTVISTTTTTTANSTGKAVVAGTQSSTVQQSLREVVETQAIKASNAFQVLKEFILTVVSNIAK